MTTAERLRAEGEARGRAEGEAHGRAALLAEQLTMRFGALSEQQRQTINDGTPEQTATWSARLIGGAATIDEVLA